MGRRHGRVSFGRGPLPGLFLAAALVPASSADEPAPGRSLIAQRLPRVVHHGGPFLRRPEVTTVTFAGDDDKVVARLEAFAERLVRSRWWRGVTEGYCAAAEDCIGPGTVRRPVRLGRRLPPRVRDVDVETLLSAEGKAGSLSGLSQDALIVVYLPPGVVLGDAFHPRYCGPGPRAYHRMLRTEAASFPYAVVPRCQDERETMATASHEILEATTNPDPQRPGFRLGPEPSWAGFRAYGAEPVDPCGLLNLDRHRARTSGVTVQRAWSNLAAERGSDPCVPSPHRPYVALVPRQPVVRLAQVGATASVVLDAVSDRAVPGWTVSAVDLTGRDEGEHYVEARLDRSEVGSGDAAVLTLRVLRVHPRGTSTVGLVSRLGAESHLWPIAVSMR